MILVDKKYKKIVMMRYFAEIVMMKNMLNAVSYDLHISGIVENNNIVPSYVLRPGEVVFIKTVEEIHMPNDLIGRIGEKIHECVRGYM